MPQPAARAIDGTFRNARETENMWASPKAASFLEDDPPGEPDKDSLIIRREPPD